MTSGRLTHLAFRLQHDCPVALVSRSLPQHLMRSWSGHSREVLHVRCTPDEQTNVRNALMRHMPDATIIDFQHGVIAILENPWPKSDSISRKLEEHKALWLQPLQYQAGWEYYDVLSLDDGALQTYLTDLLKKYPMEVVSRSSVDETALLSAFFVPLNPVLETLTEKQEAALLAAWREGYYNQPRSTTTRQVAAKMGISRSAFEERLRKAENLLINGVSPSLASLQRGTRDRKA